MTRLALTLSDEEKVGASKVFFNKVKEELQFIPAQLKVLEYWQDRIQVSKEDGKTAQSDKWMWVTNLSALYAERIWNSIALSPGAGCLKADFECPSQISVSLAVKHLFHP
jgi:hypothetical protein